MNWIELTRTVLESMKKNTLRTLLSLLGVIIGVMAVILVSAVGLAGRDLVITEMETFGIKSLWVYRSFKKVNPEEVIRAGTGITNEDISAIREKSSFVKYISPIYENSQVWVRYKNKYDEVRLLAVDVQYFIINNDAKNMGRLFVPEDIFLRRKVCLLTNTISRKIFDNDLNPLGKEILLLNDKYTVIGLLNDKDRSFLASIGSVGGSAGENSRVVIPISVLQQKYNTEEVDYIQAEAVSIWNARKAAEEIKTLLRKRHKDQFSYESETMQKYLETVNKITYIEMLVGIITAGISLIIGGIGIMNIMLTSVMERTREIGVRKALGARKVDILMQFLTESVIITVIGGLIGSSLAICIIRVFEVILRKNGLVPWVSVVIAVLVSMLVGIFSGLYPANRAAKLDPVYALRYE